MAYIMDTNEEERAKGKTVEAGDTAPVSRPPRALGRKISGQKVNKQG